MCPLYIPYNIAPTVDPTNIAPTHSNGLLTNGSIKIHREELALEFSLNKLIQKIQKNQPLILE